MISNQTAAAVLLRSMYYEGHILWSGIAITEPILSAVSGLLRTMEIGGVPIESVPDTANELCLHIVKDSLKKISAGEFEIKLSNLKPVAVPLQLIHPLDKDDEYLRLFDVIFNKVTVYAYCLQNLTNSDYWEAYEF